MLKRTIRTIASALMLTVIMAALPGAGSAYAETGQSLAAKDPDKVDARDWMKYLPDDVLLSDLNLPGAHDAGTHRVLCDDEDKVWYQCQIDPIGDQKWINQHWFSKDEEIVDTGMLQKGVRYLDLRFFIPNGKASTAANLVLAHGGKVCAYRVFQDHFYVNRCEYTTNEHLLWWVRTFLDAHKGETVILDIDTDIDAGDKKPLYDFYKQLAEDQVNGKRNSKYPEIYIGDHVPTLGEARGKIVIFSHLNAGDIGGKWGEYPVYDRNKKYCGEWAMQISNTRGDSGKKTSAEAYACSKKNMKYIVRMENVFDDVDQETKWAYIKNSLNDAQANRDTYRKKGYATWMMTFTTANDIEHFKVWRTPGWYVEYVQSRTRNLINDKLNSFYGIVIMDGIDGSYAPDISKTVWKSNYYRYIDVSYEWSGDNKKCTATGRRVLDGKSTSVTVDTTKEEKQATCTEDGSAVYTADFSGSDAASWAEEQKKSVKTDRLHHDLSIGKDPVDTLTISCKREACPLHDASVIRLVTPDKTYDGNDYDLAKLSGLDEFRSKASKDEEIKITESVSYKKKDGSGYVDLDSAPSDAGEYKASAIIKIKSFKKEEVSYTLESSFKITARSVKAAGIKANDKVYDGNTNVILDCTGAKLEGVAEKDRGRIELDSNGISGRFEDAYAASGKTVIISGLSLAGDEGVISNYCLQSTAETKAKITRRPVRVIANHQVVFEGAPIISDNAHARLDKGTESGAEYEPVSGHVISEVTLTEDRTAEPKTITPSNVKIADNNGDVVTDNYDIAYVDGKLTIFEGTETFTAPVARKDLGYNGSEQSLLTEGSNVKYSSDGINDTGIDSLKKKNAGSYTVWWKPKNAPGINWQPITVTIAPGPVTVTPNDGLTKVYGNEDPVLGYTVSGLVDGDVLNGALARVRGENAGEYAITRGMLNNPNYRITVAGDKKLTITRRSVTVSGLKGRNKVYDGTRTAEMDCSGAVINGLAAWDEGKVSVAAGGEYTTPDAGEYKLIGISGATLSGESSNNYNVTGWQGSAYASIGKRPVKVTARRQGIVESKGQDIRHDLSEAELEDTATDRGAVSGHVLAAVTLTNGMQETPSVREIIPSEAKICDQQDKDTTDNYDIEYVNGRLTIMIVPLISEPGPTAHTYSGENEIMVMPGKVREGYVMQYAISDEMPSPDSPAWSEELPEARDSGLYTVWWRTVAESDTGSTAAAASLRSMRAAAASDDEPLTLVHGGSVKAMIIPNSVDLTWSPRSFAYDGMEHLPVPKAVNLAEGDKCAVTAKGAQTDPGTYTATAVSVSNPNYEITEYSKGAETEFTIVKDKGGSEKPVSKGSGTGDENHLILWILTMVLSAAMSGILVLKRRKGRAGGGSR